MAYEIAIESFYMRIDGNESSLASPSVDARVYREVGAVYTAAALVLKGKDSDALLRVSLLPWALLALGQV